MITEAMRKSGWRECPSDAVRRAWEAKGGGWQVLIPYEEGEALELETLTPGGDGDYPGDWVFRPAHPSTSADGRDSETWHALNDGLGAAMDRLDGELKEMGFL